MANAKTPEDWREIEKDVPGAKAMYEAAVGKQKEDIKAVPVGKVDPMDALCAEDPSAVECKAFD
jgi:hypothetical protein